jgi:hypothetical protein
MQQSPSKHLIMVGLVIYMPCNFIIAEKIVLACMVTDWCCLQSRIYIQESIARNVYIYWVLDEIDVVNNFWSLWVHGNQDNISHVFARYSGFNKWMQSTVELHSRPNVSILQCYVFIRLYRYSSLLVFFSILQSSVLLSIFQSKSQRGFLYTHGVTSPANKMDIFLWQI